MQGSLAAGLALVLAACGAASASSQDSSADGATQPAASTDAAGPGATSSTAPVATGPAFADLNGVMWIYSTEHKTRFTDITAKLDDYAKRGVRVLGIYASPRRAPRATR